MWTKKEIREHKKQIKRTRKALKKLAKHYGPWEWWYIHSFIEIIIKDMYEYYNKGVNVHQVDSSRWEIVNQLLKALDLLDQIEIKEAEADTNKEIDQAYKDFYTFIGKHLQEWWD